MKIFIAVFSFFFLLGCTNWMIRQECKKINWYQHGYDRAMSGQRLSGDEWIQKCEKAEFDLPAGQLDQGFKAGMGNYCTPEVAFQTGKSGQTLNLDLCSSENSSALTRKHQEGVLAYCSDGLTVGLSGKEYTKICTQEQEKVFLPEFRKGRKKYLTALVASHRESLQNIDRQLLSIERRRNDLTFRRSLLRPAQEVVERTFNPATGLYDEKRKNEDLDMGTRNQLDHEINLTNSELQREEARKNSLSEELKRYQIELGTLD